VLPSIPNVTRLSLKNCRKLSDDGIGAIHTHLKSLEAIDLGGCFNVTTDAAISLATSPSSSLTELHLSGLGWDFATLTRLISPYAKANPKNTLLHLSIGFSSNLKSSDLLTLLPPILGPLSTLGIHFSPTAVNNDVMSMLGEHGLELEALDVRGNGSFTDLMAFLDNRAKAFNEAVTQPKLKRVKVRAGAKRAACIALFS